MGHKVHPVGFRLGITSEWKAHWFAATPEEYATLVQEDLRLRRLINSIYSDAGIARVDVERSAQDLVVTINTARPGIVIGRGGQRVDELKRQVEELTGKRVRINVQEIRQPELDAYLAARNVADQLERRINFRRAMRQTIARAMQAGAGGIKVVVAGRLGGAEFARREKAMEGRVPLHTLRANIDYGLAEAHTTMGLIGVNVWIYKGDVLPERAVPVMDMAPIEVKLPAEEQVDVAAQPDEVP